MNLPESSPKPAELCRLWLDHADRQAACLTRLLEGMKKVKDALCQGRWAEHLEQLTLLEPRFQENAELQTARQSLRQVMDRATPHAIPSLEKLAALMPASEARQIRASKARLQALAADLQRQARAASILARHHLDFFQGFFADLTRPVAGSCYGPGGKLQASAPSPLIQVRG